MKKIKLKGFSHWFSGRYGIMASMPWILSGSVVIVFSFALIRYAWLATVPVTTGTSEQEYLIHIPTGASFSQVMDTLITRKIMKDKTAFSWGAKRKGYSERVIPGRYRIHGNMANFRLLSQLQSGRQEPVRVTVHQVRTPGELAGKLARRLEPDSAAWMAAFSNEKLLENYGVTPPTLFCMLTPNTYEFYWNISPEKWLVRMKSESDRWWNKDHTSLAAAVNLTPCEIVTLASILEKETNKEDERPVMAGVYLNRLRINMPLQADPTVVFAWQDFTIRRIMKKHTELQSPYNTYQNTGLPPGPICLPSLNAIEAVLQAQQHKYLYFCARADLSGYHEFAITLDEHNRNARKYQSALNRKKIR
jgi:UPF0755 protein